MRKSLAARLMQAAVVAGAVAGLVLLPAAATFASSGPSFSSGQTVDVFTLPPRGGTTGLTIFLSSTTGGVLRSVPLTYVGQITGNYQPNWAVGSWGNTWDEFSFKMPAGGTVGTTYDALIALITFPGFFSVFTRFVGYPDPSEEGYGTAFTYEAPMTPPAGQTPEFPYAVAVPLVALGAWGLVQSRRRRHLADLRGSSWAE